MIFSDHFKFSLKIIAVIGAILLGAFLWFKHKVERTIVLLSIPGHTGLRSDEQELITFNEKTHRIIIETSSGTVKMYARNPTVRVKKDGRITVDRHMFGFEARPIIGVGYSDTTRGLLGFEPFYWGAFDASVAIGVSLDHQYVFAKPYISAGYNCWGNLSVNAGVNPTGLKDLDFVLFMSVKL
jgi:hypothetical protein